MNKETLASSLQPEAGADKYGERGVIYHVLEILLALTGA